MPTPQDDTHDARGDLWFLLLTSLSVLLMFQVVRVFVTGLVYAFGERFGQTLAALPALLVFLSPFLIPLVARLIPPRRLIFITTGGLAVLRFLMQVSRDINVDLIIAGVAIVLGLATLVLAIGLFGGRPAFKTRMMQGIFFGMTIEAALHGAFLTWDYVWQPGIVPLLTAFVVTVLALVALWQVRSHFSDAQAVEPSVRNRLTLAALGPFFVLEMLFFENIGFVASAALVPLEIAFAIVLIGNAIAFVVPGRFARLPLPARAAVGVLLIIVTAALPDRAGIILAVLVPVGQAAAAALLPCILAVEHDVRPGIGRTSIVVGLGSLLFALLMILYYIGMLITLPFSYAILPSIAALVLLLTALKPTQGAPAAMSRLAVVPLALLLLPLLVFITRPMTFPADATPETGANSLRLVDYNVHSTITFDGWLDPEGIARVVESNKPDIVNLQEISRGWVIAGSLDIAEWLSRRLKMPYVYAPGHDYQFGNMILTRLPIAGWSFTRLPLHNVPMGRSLVQAKLDLGRGILLTDMNTHLSAYADTEDRIPQVETLLAVWNRAPRTLVTGDMNGHPEDADIALFLRAGLVSAQDTTGNTMLDTWSSAEPVERIDYIFGTPDLAFDDFKIPRTQASDHLPLSASVTVR